MVAAEQDFCFVAIILIEKGADSQLRSNACLTAWQIAMRVEQRDTAAYLSQVELRNREKQFATLGQR